MQHSSCHSRNHTHARSHAAHSLLRVMLLAAVALTLLTLTACSPAKSRDKALADPLSPTAYPQIAALDGLGKYIAFSSPAISVTGDGDLAVTVPIRLANGEQRGIEYKFEFFNNDGSPVQPAQDWQYMNLPPKTQRYVKGHAKTTRTKQWRLLLRDAKELRARVWQVVGPDAISSSTTAPRVAECHPMTHKVAT